jgi:hypothetical protein
MRASPHDIAVMGRYGKALAELPPARHPWSPLPLAEALDGLRGEGGLEVRPGAA